MPLNRIEQYLGNLRGDGNTIPDKPLNRIEKYLAIMCGEDYEIPKPLNRIEQYLADIAENGGGGGGGETVIVPEQTVETSEYGGAYFGNLVGDITINVGEEYTATINGTSYTVTAQDEEGQTYLGDFELSEPPFFITDDDGTWIVGMPTSGAVTVKVTQSGGASATIIEKNITANGTYNASSDSADGYNPVHVSVPNSYTAGDEGKVVSSGALVTQTAATYTANSVYDTTLIDEVTVNVSGGGSPMTLLYEDEVSASTSSTTEATVKTITVDMSAYYDASAPTYAMLAVVTDKAGARAGYFYQNVQMCYISNVSGTLRTNIRGTSVAITGTPYGVFLYVNDMSTGSLDIKTRYSAAYGTVNGTYSVKIYAVNISAL